MPVRGNVVCSALSFVRNGGLQFRHCLESALFCREHVVVDGGSTDETLALAAEYGCRVISQNVQYLDSSGRIIDFAGITNQAIAAAQFPWMLLISSDEILDATLCEAIQSACENTNPGVFAFQRIVQVDGIQKPFSSVMSNQQIRLFHRDAIHGFVKRVHERPSLRGGIIPQVLPGWMNIPFGPATDMLQKHNWYLQLEIESLPENFGYSAWIKMTLNKLLRMIWRLFRIIYIRATKPWSQCLPLRYEWLDIRYILLLIVKSFRRNLHFI